jgi:hypothetical protein
MSSGGVPKLPPANTTSGASWTIFSTSTLTSVPSNAWTSGIADAAGG